MPARIARRIGLAAVASVITLAPHLAAGAATAAERVPERPPVVARATALSASSIDGYRTNIAVLTNRYRLRSGRRALAVNWALTVACQRHANDMAARGRMSHLGSDGSDGGIRARRAGFNWSYWGENIAAGYTSSSSVVQAWINSPSHRANLLNSNFTHIGIGVQRSWNGTLYYCMLLAR